MAVQPDSLHAGMARAENIREMEVDDLGRIIDIEIAAYEHPWTLGIFRDCLRVGYDCWCLQVDGAVLGYCVLSHAAGETHLLNLCVAPDAQELQRFGVSRRIPALVLRRFVRQGGRPGPEQHWCGDPQGVEDLSYAHQYRLSRDVFWGDQ